MAHLAELPPIHRDPFDRLLIAQAMQHELTLITVDRIFSAYPVHLLENRDRNASLPVNDWIRRWEEQSGSSWDAAYAASASATRPRTSIWPVTAAEIRAERRSWRREIAC